MAGASNERPAASATGSLATRPLVHLLVYARNHRLTGTLEFHAPDGSSGSLSLWRGRVHDARTQPAVAYFGSVAYELGLIDTPTLDATLLEISRSKRLHGEVLVERGALTAAQRDQILVEQTCRKARFLFALPTDASFAFYASTPSVVEPPFTLDTIRLAWLGLLAQPPRDSVRDVIGRFATQTLRMVNESASARAGLDDDERALCTALAARPSTLAQLAASSKLPPERIDLVIYLLVIAKCIEAVPASRSSAAASPSASSSPSLPSSSSSMVAAASRSSSSMRAVGRSETREFHSSLSFRVPSVSAMKAAAGSSPRVAAVPMTLLSPAEVGAAGIAHRAQTISADDPLTVLGLPPEATAEAARAAYFRLSKLWHPDRLPADLAMFKDEVSTIFEHMTRAHRALTESSARMVAARPRADAIREIQQAIAKHDYEAAAEASDELTSANADDAEAHALAAWARSCAGDAPEATLRAALADLDRAVHLDRHCAPAHFFRGMLHKRLQNNMAAFKDFTRVVQIDSRHVDAQREIRIFEMRARRGSGEHALDALVTAARKK
jgi:hypothetical protein